MKVAKHFALSLLLIKEDQLFNIFTITVKKIIMTDVKRNLLVEGCFRRLLKMLNQASVFHHEKKCQNSAGQNFQVYYVLLDRK